MSYLVDIMLGISIAAFIVNLAFTSYRNCKSHVGTTSAKDNVILRLNVDDPVPNSSIPQAVKSQLGDRMDYKVIRHEIHLSEVDIPKLKQQLKDYTIVLTDTGNNPIGDEQKQGKAYLWVASEAHY